MIIEPWDPRIKAVFWTKELSSSPYYDTVRFIVHLHCFKKVAWQYNIDSALLVSFGANETAEQIILDMLIDEVQPLIEETYNELKKLKGGSVDVQGRPIWGISEFNPFDVEPKIPALKVAQFDESQEWNYWCGEVGKQFKPVPSKKMLQKKFEETKEYFAKKDAVYHAQADVGVKVQRNLKKLFPALDETVKCPACPNTRKTVTVNKLDRIIIHLNDEHTWTREAVADWLESLDINLEMQENV